jgi:hypothetical protein
MKKCLNPTTSPGLAVVVCTVAKISGFAVANLNYSKIVAKFYSWAVEITKIHIER